MLKTNQEFLRISYNYGPDRAPRHWESGITETDLCVTAARIASAVLSSEPPLSWSATHCDVDVTEKLAHVVRSVVGGGEGPEARFFLDTLWGEP